MWTITKENRFKVLEWIIFLGKVSNIAVVLRWYKQQYENEGKKQCCESENNSFASTYILNEKFEQQKLSQLRGAIV